MKEIVLKNKKHNYHTNEAYKTLRTNIEFSGADNKVLVITSCMPNEGKSTISLALASALEEAGNKVLLIDADMRKSVMNNSFKITEEYKGLSHLLSGQEEVANVMFKVKGKNMCVILAGVVPPNPTELLSQKRFKSLIQSARKVYDYVIIDAPPVGSVIDGAIIAKSCDASILVTATHMISRRFAQKVKAQLMKSNCPILGVILNKVDVKENGYYGKYYTEYYK